MFPNFNSSVEYWKLILERLSWFYSILQSLESPLRISIKEIAEKGNLLTVENITVEIHDVSTFESYKHFVLQVNDDAKYSRVYPVVFSLGSKDNVTFFNTKDIYDWTIPFWGRSRRHTFHFKHKNCSLL